LKIDRVHGCFQACKYDIPYQTRILTIGGTIRESLIASFGPEREDYLLALQAADILAWDIDFNTDLRKGDTFRIIAEGLYLDGEFKKFGKSYRLNLSTTTRRTTLIFTSVTAKPFIIMLRASLCAKLF